MAALLFGAFFVLLMLGIPVAIAIGVAAMVALATEGVPLMLVVQRMFAGVDSFALIAVPFFILAGDLMSAGKVSAKLVEFADAVFGFLRGGLSIVSVLAGMFFAAISG